LLPCHPAFSSRCRRRTGKLPEQQGAEVVSFDLDPNHDWDVVPFAKWDYKEGFAERRQSARKLNNAYWFAYRAFGSNAKMVTGSVYAIPEEIGLSTSRFIPDSEI
jgi:hypothetical protein